MSLKREVDGRMSDLGLTDAQWKPLWLLKFARTGRIPDLTAPNLAAPGAKKGPTFFGAYYEWMTTPPASWDDVAWMKKEWGDSPFMLKGVSRVDDALRARDLGVSAISVSNHGGNNLDGTPAAIRLVKPIADAVGSDIDVIMGRGKIERLFRTVNDGFVVELAAADGGPGRPLADLGELNRLFTAWVEQVYHHRIHSETGAAPLARWMTGH